jgi:hypothetical protein
MAFSIASHAAGERRSVNSGLVYHKNEALDIQDETGRA